MGKKDIISKKIIKRLFEAIAKNVLSIELEVIDFLKDELLRVEKREADIIAKCKVNNDIVIFHLEIQNQNDKLMPYRMARYYLDIKTKFQDIDIIQYVIYIGKNRNKIESKIDDKFMKFYYNVIDMREIDCEKFLKIDTPEALVISILCDFKGRDELDIILYILKRLKEISKEKFEDYFLMLEILSENRDLKDVLYKGEKMLLNVEIEKLPSYKIGLEKGEMLGEKRGEKRGEKKGILKGMALAYYKMGKNIEFIAQELNISIDEVRKFLKV